MKLPFWKAIRRVVVLGKPVCRADRRAPLGGDYADQMHELRHLVLADGRLTWDHKRRLLDRINARLCVHYQGIR